MGDICYRPLIEDMTWSYSRIKCYDDCRYRWFMKYIIPMQEKEMFYASYGSFMHKIIERYYRGDISKDDMPMEFLTHYSESVKGDRPDQKITESYVQKAMNYLRGFEPFPFNMVDVERKFECDIDGMKFVAIIDYIGERDGEYAIVDNKSRDLKPRSKRTKPTKKDEELDEMLEQLYIYAGAIKQEFGKFPKWLCFNCFKSGVFIEEPFIESKYYEVIDSVRAKIEEISGLESGDFYPDVEFFKCKWLCGYNDECEYWSYN